jgi:hypothetical protein
MQVLPLEYAPAGDQLLNHVLRIAALLFLLNQLGSVAHFGWNVFCFVWEQSGLFFARKLLGVGPLFISLPSAFVSLFVLLRAVAVVQIREGGRRLIRTVAGIKLVLGPLEWFAYAIYALVERRVFNINTAYGSYVFFDNCMSGLLMAAEYLITYRLFRPSDIYESPQP